MCYEWPSYFLILSVSLSSVAHGKFLFGAEGQRVPTTIRSALAVQRCTGQPFATAVLVSFQSSLQATQIKLGDEEYNIYRDEVWPSKSRPAASLRAQDIVGILKEE